MARFKDAKGREWTLVVTVGSIKRVRETCGIDLADVETAATRLSEDPVLLVDVLWVLCKYQAEHLEVPVSETDFGESLVGDPIEDATVALQEAIASFFPAKRRLLLQRLLKKIDNVRQRGRTIAEEKLEDPALEESLVEAMKEGAEKDFQASLMRLRSATGSPAPPAE